MTSRVFGMAERSATQSTKLANLKYVRVMQVVESLREEHSVPRGAMLCWHLQDENWIARNMKFQVAILKKLPLAVVTVCEFCDRFSKHVGTMQLQN